MIISIFVLLFIIANVINGFPNKKAKMLEESNFLDERRMDLSGRDKKVGAILKEIRQKIASKMRMHPQNSDHGEFLKAAMETEELDGFMEKQLGNGQNQQNAPSIEQLNAGIGDLLYQGDISLSVEQAEYLLNSASYTSENNAQNRARRQSMSAEKFPKSLWENRTVPYTFDNSFNQKTLQLIRKALDFWADNTCLRFVEEPLEMSNPETRLQFIQSTGCFSSIGKMQYEENQEISIGHGCEHFGIITHEIAHALGFFHEQSRWDRDEFVELNVDNIMPGFEDQFQKELPEDNDNQQVAYDLGSVMHYTEFGFSLPHTGPVLVAKEAHNQKTMGQRIGPSFLDVLLMNKRYGCLADCSTAANKAQCRNGGYPKPTNCSSCICPWGFGGRLCEERPNQQECGQTVQASTEWHELNGTLGEEDGKLAESFAACHWHIRAPNGRKLELMVLALGEMCAPGCFYGNVEFKLRAEFARTGIRMCCPTDLPSSGLLLKSESDLAVISLYTRKGIQMFRLRYRIGENFLLITIKKRILA